MRKFSKLKLRTHLLLQYLQPSYGSLDFAWDNPGEPVPVTHSHLSWSSIILYCFYHLLRSIASSMFNLRPWEPFCTTSLQVLFDLPLGLEPFTLYSIHFFTQTLSSFSNTCPYYYNLFCCSNNIMLSNVSISTLYLEFYLLPYTSMWPFSSLPTEMPPHFLFLQAGPQFHAAFADNSCTISLTINDISLLISNGNNCLNIYHPIRILVFTAASISPSILHMSLFTTTVTT